MSKSITHYATDWQRNAEEDAFWVILTDPKFADGKWNIERFFETGEIEVDRLFGFMEKHSLSPPSGIFLDFGCGVGRISKALTKRFDGGYGVDIAQKMVELAREYVEGVDFVVNEKDNLDIFDDNTIDFIYSHIVLHHIPDYLQKRYIDQFCRVLKPGGLAVFQIATQRISPTVFNGWSYYIKQILQKVFPFLVLIKNRLRRSNPNIIIEMHELPHEVVEGICERKQCVLELITATNSCDADLSGRLYFYDIEFAKRNLRKRSEPAYLGVMYFVRKPLNNRSPNS